MRQRMFKHRRWLSLFVCLAMMASMLSGFAVTVSAESDEYPTPATIGVYIDGVNGIENGTGEQDSPVKTFAQAKALLADSNEAAIGVLNTITVSGEEEWKPDSGKIYLVRANGFTGNLVSVTGELTLSNVVKYI